MAYVKTNWQTGDVITAAKLNNMETGIYNATEAAADAFVADIDDPQDGDTLVYDATAGVWKNGEAGGGGGSLVVNGTTDETDPSNVTITLDKTAGEIYDAFTSGSPVIANMGESGNSAAFQMFYAGYTADSPSGNYIFRCYDGYSLMLQFSADAGTDYPVANMPS